MSHVTRPPFFPSGFLVIDKPEGWTSFDVVAKLRRLTGIAKIGHLGTLDPLATGVLVVAVGEGTKLIEYFMKLDKIYEVTAEVGKVSDTYDGEGQVTPVEYSPALYSEEKLRALLPKFVGDILQIPPAYSAIKLKGRPAYALARAGEKPTLAARRVHVHDITLHTFTPSTFLLRVRCGSGTYIRSLIHDLGQHLGTGAFVTTLRRLSVGCFSLDRAVSLTATLEDLQQAVIPLEAVVEDWPRLVLDEPSYARLRQGQAIPLLPHLPPVASGTPVAAFYEDRLVSLLTLDFDRIKVLKNISTSN